MLQKPFNQLFTCAYPEIFHSGVCVGGGVWKIRIPFVNLEIFKGVPNPSSFPKKPPPPTVKYFHPSGLAYFSHKHKCYYIFLKFNIVFIFFNVILKTHDK